MGYTHYWTTEESVTFSKEEWDKLKETARLIFKECKTMSVKLCYDEDKESSPPRANNTEINFNGFKDLSHETFRITPTIYGFDFCKTARKPYDVAVTALLIYIHAHKPNIKINSSGDNDDWVEGWKLLHKVTGEYFDIPDTI